jgi:hypothetical protein
MHGLGAGCCGAGQGHHAVGGVSSAREQPRLVHVLSGAAHQLKGAVHHAVFGSRHLIADGVPLGNPEQVCHSQLQGSV